MYEVIFYTDRQGGCPTDDFLDSLRDKVKGKVEKWIQISKKNRKNSRSRD